MMMLMLCLKVQGRVCPYFKRVVSVEVSVQVSAWPTYEIVLRILELLKRWVWGSKGVIM